MAFWMSLVVGQPGKIDVVLDAVAGHFLIEAGGDDELRAGVHGGVDLLDGQNGARADQNLRQLLSNAADGLLGSGSAEGDLRDRQTAVGQSAAQRHGVVGVGQLDNGNDTQRRNLLDHIHWYTLLTHWFDPIIHPKGDSDNMNCQK